MAATDPRLRRVEPPTLVALAVGALVGGVVGQSLVSVLATRCPTVEAIYGVCHNYVLTTPHLVAIDAGCAVAGAVLGAVAWRLCSPTLRRFVGTGTRQLPRFVIRGEGARMEWLAEGAIRITDRDASGLEIRSSERSGHVRLPAGGYALAVSAPGAWCVRVERG